MTVSPSLHEFFQSHHHTLRETVEPLARDISKQTTEKIKTVMLELQHESRAEALREQDVQRVSLVSSYTATDLS